MQNRIIIQEHKSKLLNIKEKRHKDVETRCRKWRDEHQLHQPKLVAAQTLFDVLNTILVYFFAFLFFSKNSLFSVFLLTFVTIAAQLATKGAHKDQLRWMAQHKNKKLGWEFVAGRKQGWDGWVLAASDLMIRTKITLEQCGRREKKNSATRQILKD